MGPIIKEIKAVFNRYRYNSLSFEGKICSRDPFCNHFWMYHYLFPETLLVWEDVCCEEWAELKYADIPFKDFYLGCTYSYPCSVFSEEQILRIMAECGLL